MQSILPKERLAPTRINPRISLFYGVPKVGKTTLMAMLENCLLLDFEKGAESLEVQRIPINSVSGGTMYEDDPTKPGHTRLVGTSVDSVYNEILKIGMEEFQKTGKKPKPPYKFLVVDTIDKLEDYCEVTATAKYKQSTIGKNFDGNSVIELPQGGGYYHLRKEVLMQIDRLATICEHLILVSHIKEKLLNKGGMEVAVRDISLTGKLGSMVAAKADIIGYLYREPGKGEMMVSFETYESSVMGARFARLAGQHFPFDWNRIFLPEHGQSAVKTVDPVSQLIAQETVK